MFLKFFWGLCLSFNVFSMDKDIFIPKITYHNLIAASNCYLENLRRHDREPICQQAVNVIKKTKISPNFNKYNFCHQMLMEYEQSFRPQYCRVIYCSPCMFKEV